MKKAWMLGLAGLALTSLTACSETAPGASAGADSLAEMDTITLRVNETVPLESGAGKAWDAYLDRVEERTEGKVKFDRFYASALISSEEAFPAIPDGVVDITQVTVQDAPDKQPISNYIAGASGLIDPTFPLSLLQGRPATSQYFSASEAINQENEDLGAHVLFAGSSGYGNLLCTKPLESVADAKGLRVRVDGGASQADAEALGMEPIDIPVPEMFEGLQRGIIDCVMASDGGENFVALGLVEVAKYFSPLQMSPTAGFGMTFNKAAWDALPGEVQDIFHEELAQYEVDRNKSRMEGFAKFAAASDEHGIEWEDATELNAVLQAAREKHLAELVDNAPDSVDDPQAMIDEYAESLEKWLPIAEEVSGIQSGGGTQDLDELRTAYETAAEQIDWDAYADALAEMYKSNG